MNASDSAELLVNRTAYAPSDLDGGVAAGAGSVLIVLATDHTLEHEFRKIFRIDGVALYATRIRNAAEINPTTLAAMEAGLGCRGRCDPARACRWMSSPMAAPRARW